MTPDNDERIDGAEIRPVQRRVRINVNASVQYRPHGAITELDQLWCFMAMFGPDMRIGQSVVEGNTLTFVEGECVEIIDDDCDGGGE